MGDANHILVSSEMVNDLMEMSNDYESILHPLKNFGIKHGDNLLTYSAFGNGFGNPIMPIEKIKITPQILDAEKYSKYEKIIFNIILKDKTNNTRFERYYYFSNDSSEPIYEIVIGIVTNSEEEFQTFKIQIFDEDNKELEIIKILSSTPFSKKIVVKLTKPVFTGDSGRMVKMEYDAKLSESYFENLFLNETPNFELNFSYYANVAYSPKLYYFDNEQGSKNMLSPSPKTTKGMFTNNKWEKSKGISGNDMIRLEW